MVGKEETVTSELHFDFRVETTSEFAIADRKNSD
jgi:hypothetical protein